MVRTDAELKNIQLTRAKFQLHIRELEQKIELLNAVEHGENGMQLEGYDGEKTYWVDIDFASPYFNMGAAPRHYRLVHIPEQECEIEL